MTTKEYLYEAQRGFRYERNLNRTLTTLGVIAIVALALVPIIISLTKLQ